MNKDSVKVKVEVAFQGDAFVGQGYMLKSSENVAAFYIDGGGHTGRAYPICSSSTVTFADGSFLDYPSIDIEDDCTDSVLTTIYFPEYIGWKVHSVGGGKTMSICLVKD